MIVTVRHITLLASGAVVLLLSVYLFVAVNASPARPSPDAIRPGNTAPIKPPTPPVEGGVWSPGAGSPQARAELTRTQLVGSDNRVEPGSAVAPPAIDNTPTDNSNVDEDLKSSDGKTQASKMFDRGDWDEASKQALKMLETDPKDARMLRIVVSVACFTGDPDKAQKYWSQLGEDRDKAQMAVRCGRYGITFKQ
jgi:hypothetical protein